VLPFPGGAPLNDITIDPTRRYAYISSDTELGADRMSVLVKLELPPPP
jgi:hypothetical protein